LALRWAATSTTYSSIKGSHTKAYDISVCERMRFGYLMHTSFTFQILGHTPVYVVLYIEVTFVLDMFIYQRLPAYRIYVTHTLIVSTTYAWYARHTLNTLKVRYSYVIRTMSIHYACVHKVLWSIGVVLNIDNKFSWKVHTLLKICIRNTYAIVWLHLESGRSVKVLKVLAWRVLVTLTIFFFYKVIS